MSGYLTFLADCALSKLGMLSKLATKYRITERQCKYCVHCYNNWDHPLLGFWNHRVVDNALECWNGRNAKVIPRKFIPYGQEPPWKQKCIRTLSCLTPHWVDGKFVAPPVTKPKKGRELDYGLTKEGRKLC